jgi:hypothetical protein
MTLKPQLEKILEEVVKENYQIWQRLDIHNDKKFELNKELYSSKASQILALIESVVPEEKEIDYSKPDFVSNNQDALYGYNLCREEMLRRVK